MQEKALSKYWYLKQIKLFSHLPEKEMKTLEATTFMKSFGKGKPIYLPGEPAKQIYLLKQGRVKISRQTADGHELTMDILEPGDIFGEIEVLEDTERDTMAAAMDDAALCVMSKENFEKFIKLEPEISIRLTKLMGLRLKKIESRIEDLIYKDVPSRLARLILDLADKMGETDKTGIHVKIGLTHQEIANLIASTRETVSLTLGEFRDKELIEFNRKEIFIRNKNGLATYL